MKNRNNDLALLKARLYGPNLKKTLASKKTNKYRLSKATGINYRTLCSWQRGDATPSDGLALLAGKWLGLIDIKAREIIDLQAEIARYKERLDRLVGGAIPAAGPEK